MASPNLTAVNRSARVAARQDREGKRLKESLNARYERAPVLQNAVTAGRNQVQIGGHYYPAEGIEGQGAAINVVNIGTPAVARYAPANTRSVVSAAGTGRSGGSSGGGGGGTYFAGDAISIDGSNNINVVRDATGAIVLGGGGGLRINTGSGLGISSNALELEEHALVGGFHTATGLTVGHTIRATGASAFAWAQLQHGDLGGVTANQHHNQQHVLATNLGLGSDHTISGASVGHVLRATSASAARFAQLQHDDLGGVTANQHHFRVHNIITGDDIGVVHTITGNTFDLVGATALNTLGLHTPSTDVSAGVARILRSTASGGLGLGSLFTTGAVDVGQGFTAGNTGFRVIYHTHDYPHTHVVVNPGESWNLDEQFGLDVDDNLLVRGWIVGKHAIQLDGATMILHFDGPDRIGDLSGQTRGHMGQVPINETGVTFAPGKFGKAIQTPPQKTNYILNPSFEASTANWAAYATGSAAGTRTRVTEMAYAGTYSYELKKTGGATGDRWGAQGAGTIFTPTTYTASVWVNIPAAAGGLQTLTLETGGALGTGIASVTGPTDGWVRLSVTRTTASTGAVYAYVYINNADTMTAYIDAVQIEATPYATAYLDGSLGGGHSWTGTAHLSASQRTGAVLNYDPVGAINQRAGTIMAWVYPTTASVNQMWFSHFSGGDTFIRALSTGFWDFSFGGTNLITTAPVTANAWTHVALTWEGTTAAFYINGAQVRTGTVAALATLASTFAIGRYGASNNQHWSGLIDDVVILGRASPPDEVRAVYDSNAPVFAETSTWHWRVGRNRIYADAEGLWAYGANNGAILGLYAGSEEDPAATKSWGGVFLGEGDLLIGRSPNAYMLWDASANQLFLHRADITLNDGISNRGELTSVGNLTLGTNIAIAGGRSFQVISQGGNAGDVIIGNVSSVPPAGGDTNYLWWDQSGGLLRVKGDLLIEGSSYLTEDDLSTSPTITGIQGTVSGHTASIGTINTDIDTLETAVGTTLPDNIATAQAYSEIRRIAAVGGSWTPVNPVTFVVDNNTIWWSSVTIRRGDGTTKSVSNGNTGNMGARTYLYTDLAAGGTLTLSTATDVGSIPAGNTIVAVCQPGTEAADVQVIGGATRISGDSIITGSIVTSNIKANAITSALIAANQITSTHIAANQVTADKIAANAITSTKIAANQITGAHINAENLSAIKANTGDLNVTGTLQIGTGSSGTFRSTKAHAGDTSTQGWWFGYSGGNFQWIIGDAVSGFIQNNGSSMGMFLSQPLNIAGVSDIFSVNTSGANGKFGLYGAEAGFPGDPDAKGVRFRVDQSFQSTGSMHANKFDQDGNTLRIRAQRTPATAGATGLTGEWCWDPNYFYVCVNTNTWKRAALSTW